MRHQAAGNVVVFQLVALEAELSESGLGATLVRDVEHQVEIGVLPSLLAKQRVDTPTARDPHLHSRGLQCVDYLQYVGGAHSSDQQLLHSPGDAELQNRRRGRARNRAINGFANPKGNLSEGHRQGRHRLIRRRW